VIGRIVEIASDGRYLSIDRGFMVVSRGTECLGKVPLDDIAGLICNTHALTYSNNLLVALAQRSCPVVLCGKNHMPAGLIWPAEGHHRQGARLDIQIAATVPLKKRLWKALIQSKLIMQAAALELCNRPGAPLRAMVRKVKAGDTSNTEGQGARTHWSLLFGKQFRRDPDAPGVNALLNYGYTVVRSVVARHVMGHGLNPGIGLHHANDGNAMRLVDDLMEPFRPVADAWVYRLNRQGISDVTNEAKRALGLLPTRTMITPDGRSPLTLVVQRLCSSLVRVLDGTAKKLVLPHIEQDVLTAIWNEPDETGNADEEEATA
jgi:CRISPR-associated protein Cas1